MARDAIRGFEGSRECGWEMVSESGGGATDSNLRSRCARSGSQRKGSKPPRHASDSLPPSADSPPGWRVKREEGPSVSASSIDADHPPDATLVSLETGC